MSRIHSVRQGECLMSIAHKYGFADYRLIYDHPKNAELKRRRPNPGLMMPGDKVFIPARESLRFTCETGKSHTFVVQLPKRTISLKLRDPLGKPIANTEYTLIVDQQEWPSRKTDEDGLVNEEVPAYAKRVELRVNDEVVTLNLGHLNPVEEVHDDGVSGIQGRLANLGYYEGESTGVLDEATEEAIRAFQADQDIAVDGAVTDELCAALTKAHGC